MFTQSFKIKQRLEHLFLGVLLNNKTTDLVLKLWLDGKLLTVCDTFAIFPHIVDQQTAGGRHGVTDRETQIRHADVHFVL